MRVVTAAQMKQIEEKSLAYDLTYQRLMENAGCAAAAFIRRTFSLAELNCMIFCARGNNGGDGYVVARKLAEEGANIVIVQLDGPPVTDCAAVMYNTARLMELPILSFEADREKVLRFLEQTDIIVDAICGTGFKGALREAHRDACRAINNAIAAVISLDIPTGAECDNGAADPDAVRADFTIAFDSLKPVHVLPAAEPFCGKVEVVDIGIPAAAHEGIAAHFGETGTERVFQLLKPRAKDSHKGMFGKVLCIAGSSHYRGAAVLACTAALRAGAGLVCLASVEEACAATVTHLPEATLLPLPKSAAGGIDADAAAPLLESQLAGAQSVLFGCGLGNTMHTLRLLEYVLAKARCPVVIDADGINALAQNIHVLQSAEAPVLITPHPGEMARLCGCGAQEISADRQGVATRFATEHGVTLVLKGSGTVIAAPDGGLLLCPTGNPGLAKGGSGDILAGMLAAFLAQGLAPADASHCAVHLHGLAADYTAARRSQYGMLPSELLDDLAMIFLEHNL